MSKSPVVELKLPVLPDMELSATQTAEVVAKHMELSEEKSAETVALEILDVYSKKNNERGFLYVKENDIDNELKNSFSFIETPDQKKAIREVLKDMNRKHTVDFYRKIVDKLREERSDIALSSDFIVGYPNETDKDFEETISILPDFPFIWKSRASLSE